MSENETVVDDVAPLASLTPHQAEVRAVATFIADEITAGAAVARKAFAQDRRKPGSVSEHKLQYVLDGAIKDYLLLTDVGVVEPGYAEAAG